MAGSRELSLSQRQGTSTTLRALALTGLDRATLLKMHRTMVLARTLDEVERKLRRQGKTYFEIGCAGHEGVQVAAAVLLKPGHDWFYPYYRDHALCFGLGVTPLDVMLQSMGKSTDPSSGGREMPAHFGSPELHIVSQSSPTGTQYLQAVGTAEAGVLARAAELHASGHRNGRRGDPVEQRGHLPRHASDEVVYVSGGDGSTSEGEFYEALSLASLRKLPVLFLVQDNGYAISVPVEVQTPAGSISATFRGFPSLCVEEMDGSDIVETYLALRRAVLHVRAGQGPALVHARLARLGPHSDSDDDRAYKTQAERAADQARDPIATFERLLALEGYMSPEEIGATYSSARDELVRAADEASKAPNPDPATATLHVYSSRAVVVDETEPAEASAPQTMVEVINHTLETEMERDPRIICFGEDVADLSRSKYLDMLPGKGGVFKVTQNLQRKFGDHRVFNTPIGEAGIVGRAVGLAVRGFIPVAEIQFLDYIWPAMQQIRNEVGMMRWRSNNAFSLPMVLRVPTGGYLTGGGPYHSQSAESIFCHCPGLRVVMPSNARDAAGLLRTALRCGDPVLFLEHKHLYRRNYARSADPGPDHVIPLGRARTVAQGRHLTVITYGAIVEKSLQASRDLGPEGVELEVIDLRSLQPYDWDAIRASVRKTSRVLIAHEDQRTHGFGAEIAARIADELFADLDAPVGRVGAQDAPVGYAPSLEHAVLPQVKDIVDAARRLIAY